MMLAKLVLAGSFAVLAFAAPVADECSGTYRQDNGYCHGHANAAKPFGLPSSFWPRLAGRETE